MKQKVPLALPGTSQGPTGAEVRWNYESESRRGFAGGHLKKLEDPRAWATTTTN